MYEGGQGTTVDYKTARGSCTLGGNHELRLTDKEIRYDSVVDRYVYPLPSTIGEAMQNPRRLRLLPAWDEAVHFLVENGFDIHNHIKIETFGLKEYDIGRRSLRTQFNSIGTILQAVEATWQDAIEGRSFQVFMLVPQPINIPFDSVGFIVEIYTATVDIDRYAPILFEYHTYTEGTSDITMVQRTDYLLRNGRARDVYDLALVTNLCAPIGNHRCAIELGNGISTSSEEAYDIGSGSYVVLQITPPSWKYPGGEELVKQAALLQQEISRLIRDPTDPYITVGTHAVDRLQRPIGRQYFLLPRRSVDNHCAIWNLVAATWQNYIETNDMTVTYVHATPQPEVAEFLHFIVEEVSRPDMVPILVTYFLPATTERSRPEELGTFAVQTPTPTSYTDIAARAYPDTEYTLSQFRGQVWCEDHYNAFDEWLAVESGTHILIYSNETDGTEYAESATITDDQSIQIEEDIPRHVEQEDAVSPAMTVSTTLWHAAMAIGSISRGGPEAMILATIPLLPALL